MSNEDIGEELRAVRIEIRKSLSNLQDSVLARAIIALSVEREGSQASQSTAQEDIKEPQL